MIYSKGYIKTAPTQNIQGAVYKINSKLYNLNNMFLCYKLNNRFFRYNLNRYNLNYMLIDIIYTDIY